MEIFFQQSEFFFLPGLIVGLIGHIFGLGGGILMVPVMKAAGFSMHEAISSSLAVIVFNSIAVSYRKLKHNQIFLPATGPIEMSGIFGATVGSLVALALDSEALSKVFAVFATVMAILVIVRNKSQSFTFVKRDSEGKGLAWSYFDPQIGKKLLVEIPSNRSTSAIGLVGGMLSSLLGIGSGAFMVPAMVVFSGYPIKVAAATSSYVSGIFAACGMIIMREHVMWEATIPLIFGVIGGTYLSERYVAKIQNEVVSWGLAILLILISIKMWL